MADLGGGQPLLAYVQREDGVAARRLGVHLRRGRGARQGAHVQALHGLVARADAARRRPGHVDAAGRVLVDLHVRFLTLFFLFVFLAAKRFFITTLCTAKSLTRWAGSRRSMISSL